MTDRTSRTSRWSALLAAAALAVMHPGTAPAKPADTMVRQALKHAKLHDGCGAGLGEQTGLFKACGEFPIDLPMSFAYNPLLNQVTGPEFVEALNGAADAWNHPFGIGTPSPFGTVIDIATTTTRGAVRDGVNVVVWGNTADCGLPGVIAVACLRYDGASGDARHRIVEVDIILNYDETWRQASAADELSGIVSGTAAQSFVNWIDLESVLAHEFGHAIGLEHIGTPGFPYPSRLADTGQHLQTMYRYDFRGSTIKRTLDVGDILGLRHVTENT